jgi:hypothetical protein
MLCCSRVHLKGFAPSLPSIKQFVVDTTTDTLKSNRCAKDKTLSTHDLNSLPVGFDEQAIVDSCASNVACLFAVRSATELVLCSGFEEGDLGNNESRLLGEASEATEATLLKTCGEEIGDAFQKFKKSPGFDTFIKIPSSTNLDCTEANCLPDVVEKIIGEGVPKELLSANGVDGTSLLSIDGPLSLLGDDGHLDNVCFGPEQFASFKNDVLRVVSSQPTDEKKARMGAVIVRLAGHDLMDFSVNAGNGGSDGCILWGELKGKSMVPDDGDNKGIENAWRPLKPICAKYQFSRADCLVLAAEVVITSTSNNKVKFNSKVGRKDADSCDFNRSGPGKSRLPEWFNGGGTVNKDANAQLRERLGITWPQYVALLGVHNLGGISTVNTGIPQRSENTVTSARWKRTWKQARQFDNGYYRNLMGEKWFECDKSFKVMLKCNEQIHGGGSAFFGIWNAPNSDQAPTALGPLANKQNRQTKKQMISLSTDMAIATDIHSVKRGEPCPGCSKRDLTKTPKGNPTSDYRDSRKSSSATVTKYAKNQKAFFADFPAVWSIVTENGHLQSNLRTIDSFANTQCTIKAPVNTPAPAPAKKPNTPACGKVASSCERTRQCHGGRNAKCIKTNSGFQCLCHRSECAVNGVCSQDPNFKGKRGGLSLQMLEADGNVAHSVSQGHSVAALVGAALCGAVGAILAVAAAAMFFKRKARSEQLQAVPDANMASL